VKNFLNSNFLNPKNTSNTEVYMINQEQIDIIVGVILGFCFISYCACLIYNKINKSRQLNGYNVNNNNQSSANTNNSPPPYNSLELTTISGIIDKNESQENPPPYSSL